MPAHPVPTIRSSARSLLAAVALAWLAACAGPGPDAVAAPSLPAYRSDEDLVRALDRWRAEAGRRQLERRSFALSLNGSPGIAAQPMAAPPAPAPATAGAVAAKSADGAAAAAESITNVQTAGVDEGGIVKRAGDHLVVLRRGRLFTVRIGADSLQPVSTVDAYAPGSDPRGAWYDEMLVSGNTIVVIGYSYARGGTEIGLFEIDARGGLTYRSTHHLRSYDYYSSRNYASRLIGRKLVFYSPTVLRPGGPAPLTMLPSYRRWDGAVPGDWQRILPATRIHRTDDDFDPDETLALHTVTSCDLGDPGQDLRCESTAALGPAGRVFYVSQGSVYVWTVSRTGGAGGRPDAGGGARSAVFRIPLDGTAPTALKTAGVPTDQLSFLEDGRGHLNVLLRGSGVGEGMFGNARVQGGTALLRVPLASFGDGRGSAPREAYRLLPASQPTQNRYVGDWLLYGGAQRDGRQSAAWAVRWAGGGDAVPLDPGHAVERIEAMGAHGVLVGNTGSDLVFSAVRLDRGATLAGRHVQPGARQGETRTHGFFYRPTGTDQGLLGLPVIDRSGRGGTMQAGNQGSASVLFLRERALDFRALGDLRSAPVSGSDGCRASCVDWYGNARPMFIGERVFALMGYELVEGRLDGGMFGERLAERRRVNFMPGARGDVRPTPFGG